MAQPPQEPPPRGSPRPGIVLHHGVGDGAQLRGFGRLAERLGYDSLWVTERYFHEETCALLGFLAAGTERIRLGVGVVNPWTRPPPLLAMAAATLDRLSGGRVALGLGRSDRAVIADALGLPYERPRERLREAALAVRRLLAGERAGGVRLALAPPGPPPPIYLAAIGRRALRLAGEVADGVLLNAYVPPAYVRWAAAEVRAAAREAGRDPAAVRIACMLVVRLADRPETPLPQLRERLAVLLAEPHVGETLLARGGFDPSLLPRLRRTLAASGPAEAARLVGDATADAFALLGPSARCRERIAEYREAGVDEPLLLPRLPDFPRTAEALAPEAG